ncbi:MAG: hypothetical protein P8177_13315 [Gemmatimonadota bacterium]|jgi:hypothetical protein
MRFHTVLAALACLLAPGLSPDPALGQAQGLGFAFQLGYSALDGEWGDVLDDGVDGEFNILWGLGRFRFGGGFNWVSYGLIDPVGEVDSASQVGTHLSVGYFLLDRGPILPYLEGRLTHDRLRAEDHVEGFPPPEEEDGNNAPRYSGWGGTAIVGAVVPLRGTVAMDVAVRLGRFVTSEADLDYLGLGTVSTAVRKGVRLGVVWHP